MPEVKYPADGNTYVGFLVDPTGDAIGNVHTPELSELEDIIDLSCDIMSGGLAPGISQGTIDAASLCSRFVAQSQGRVTVAPALTFWRYNQPDDTAWDLVENGKLGWLIIRSGYPTETDLAVGQSITVAYVAMGEPMPEYPGGDTNATFTSNMLLVNGQLFDQKAEIVTVASA